MITSISNSPISHAYYTNQASATGDTAKSAEQTTSASADSKLQLSEADLKVIEQLKKRDTEVRAHELAHLAAAAGVARSGASFSYQLGPDGVSYAIGGEVNIDTSEVAGNPQATLRKAQIIKSAALAPAEPSNQDFQVAAAATAMAIKAISEIAASARGETQTRGAFIDVSA